MEKWIVKPFFDFFIQNNPIILTTKCEKGVIYYISKQLAKFSITKTIIIELNSDEQNKVFEMFQKQFKKRFLSGNENGDKKHVISLISGRKVEILKGLSISPENDIPLILFDNSYAFEHKNIENEDIFQILKNFRKKQKSLSLFLLESEVDRENLEYNIFSAYIKQEKKPNDRIKFAMTFNCFEVLESSTITAQEFQSFENISNLFTKLLINDRWSHCKIFLKDFTKLKENFKLNDLIKIYSNEIFEKNSSDILLNLKFELERNDDEPSKIFKFKKALEKSLTELCPTFQNFNFLYIDNEPTEIQLKDIFFFCVICNKMNTAKVCWEFMDHPMRYALIAVKIFKHLSSKAANLKRLSLSIIYKNLADEWEKHAYSTLNNCFECMQESSENLLIYKIGSRLNTDIFYKKPIVTYQISPESILFESTTEDETLISLAHSSKAMNFIHTTCCQEKLTKIWYKNLCPSMSPLLIIFYIFCPIICFQKLNKLTKFDQNIKLKEWYHIPVVKFWMSTVIFLHAITVIYILK